MNIEIYHPGEGSMEHISQVVKEGGVIRRSPHVGNVNGPELAFINGVARFGGEVHMVQVDTIRAKDGYASPRYVISGQERHPVSSRANSSRVAVACPLNEDSAKVFSRFNVDVAGMSSVVTAHESALRMVLDDRVFVDRYAEWLSREISDEEFSILLAIAIQVVNRQPRRVTEQGKIVEYAPADSDFSVFGRGQDPMEGIMPSLEAMLAAEMVITARSTDGNEIDVSHVAGPHMIEYTKDPAIMGVAIEIARRTASELGIRTDTKVNYFVPGMEQVTRSSAFREVAGDLVEKVYPMYSQYDLIEAANE